MKEIFDPAALGAESKIDVGLLFLGAGIGGILDATLNVAEFAQPLTFAALCGPTVLGVKKIVDGLRERQKPTALPPRQD